MDYMSKYSATMDYVVGKIEALPDTSLYEVIVRFVDKYKELEEKVKQLESLPREEKKEKRNVGRPKKRK